MSVYAATVDARVTRDVAVVADADGVRLFGHARALARFRLRRRNDDLDLAAFHAAWAADRRHGAAAAISPRRHLRAIPALYVEVIRNTPLLVQIYIIYFGLPAIGIRLTPPVAAVLALGIYTGAYADRDPACRNSIDFRRAGGGGACAWPLPLADLANVLAGQALAAMYSALVSQLVLLMLASSLVSRSLSDLQADRE